MAQSKPLFLPWLLQQIQSRSFPGVSWTDQDQKQFSVPWKHALRQDSSGEDVLIFKAWAQTSAGGDGRINGDPSVWKRNFRSALRAKGFKMVVDNKNDSTNPHKVYQFPDDSPSVGLSDSQDSDISPVRCPEERSSFPAQFDLNQCLIDLNLQENCQQVVWSPGEFIVNLQEQDLYQDATQIYETERCPVQDTIGEFEPIGVTESQFPAATACFEVERPFLANQLSLETFFQIKVYYKGVMVLDELVKDTNGFRLMYDQPQVSNGLPVVKLPELPDSVVDQKQIKFTKDIMNNLGSLEITSLNGVVSGQRCGQSKIYWGHSKHEHSYMSRELSKTTPEIIFLFKHYISGLYKFVKSDGTSPLYSLFFCLGEKWPDPTMRPWDKKLIMVEVILKSLEDLKNMAVEGGASSLKSMELQLSLEQMMELY